MDPAAPHIWFGGAWIDVQRPHGSGGGGRPAVGHPPSTGSYGAPRYLPEEDEGLVATTSPKWQRVTSVKGLSSPLGTGAGSAGSLSAVSSPKIPEDMAVGVGGGGRHPRTSQGTPTERGPQGRVPCGDTGSGWVATGTHEVLGLWVTMGTSRALGPLASVGLWVATGVCGIPWGSGWPRGPHGSRGGSHLGHHILDGGNPLHRGCSGEGGLCRLPGGHWGWGGSRCPPRCQLPLWLGQEPDLWAGRGRGGDPG